MPQRLGSGCVVSPLAICTLAEALVGGALLSAELAARAADLHPMKPDPASGLWLRIRHRQLNGRSARWLDSGFNSLAVYHQSRDSTIVWRTFDPTGDARTPPRAIAEAIAATAPASNAARVHASWQDSAPHSRWSRGRQQRNRSSGDLQVIGVPSRNPSGRTQQTVVRRLLKWLWTCSSTGRCDAG